MDIGKIGSINNNILYNINNKVNDDSFEKHLKSALEKNDDAQLKKACQEFEGIMLNMMFKQMKAAIPKSDFFGQDIGREIFESMYNDKLIEEVSKRQDLGLADMLYKQLSRQLEKKNRPNDGEALEAAE